MIDAVKFLRILNFWILAYIVTLVMLIVTIVVIARILWDLGNRPLSEAQIKWLEGQRHHGKDKSR